MLSISKGFKGAGRGDYYLDLAREDCYLAGGEPAGKWLGSGAKTLALGGVVTAEQFRRLLNGYAPDGKTPLVQNAGRRDRLSAWDLTFSAPKSVSVFWAIASKESRQRVQEAHHRAVEAALEYLEEVAGLTRRGHAGKSLEPAGLAFATFEHGTSRAHDPQLHTHAILLNLGFRADGTTGALWSQEFFNHKMAAGALYRAELAHQMERHVGVAVDRQNKNFRIRGVPSDLCRLFSKRRQEIERVMKERSLTGAVAAKVVTLDTRHVKQHVAREKLFDWWREVGRAHGWKSTDAERLVAVEKRDLFPNIEESMPIRQIEKKRTEARPSAPIEPTRERPATTAGNQRAEHPETGSHPSEIPKPTENSPESQRGPRPRPELGRAPSEGFRTGQLQEDPVRNEARSTQAIDQGRGNQKPSPVHPDAQKLVENLWRKRSDFSYERDFVRAAAEEAPKWGFSARDILKAVRKYRPLEVRHQRLFPNAPEWNPLGRAAVPYLAIKTKRKRPREHPVLLKQKKIPGFEIQVIKERVFPDLPRRNPLSKLRLPKLKVIPHRYTEEERRDRREAKQLGRRLADFFDPGDRIQFEKDSPTLGVERGQHGGILKVRKDSLVIQLDDGSKVHIPLSEYQQITLVQRSNTGPQATIDRASAKQARRERERQAREEQRRREEEERRRQEQERSRQQEQSQSRSQSL